MTAPTWDPARYLRYAGPRLRPGLDLLARIDVADPREIHDLGCGTGYLARLIADRWPEAHVVGSDSSQEMLEEARRLPSRVEWRQLDATRWDPPTPLDVIYSNAVLHWIPEHDALLVRLLASLRPGGQLAVQMPLSWYEPSHELMRTILEDEQLGTPELRSRYAKPNVAAPDHYADLLARNAAVVDLWTTRYYQVLRGPDPVLEWVSGTGLRPILQELVADEQSLFLDRYRQALRGAYPVRNDGATSYPFPRLFIVATAGDLDANRIDS